VDDVPALFAASDVFVMPSLYEGFPIAALEALGCALPVLLADTPGLSDFRELTPGVAFAEPTADALAPALDRILSEPSDRSRSEAARLAELARARFGLEAGVERYLRLYAGGAPDAGPAA
jgi:glycosyltransferase involved in cell wall biosynthesis